MTRTIATDEVNQAVVDRAVSGSRIVKGLREQDRGPTAYIHIPAGQPDWIVGQRVIDSVIADAAAGRWMGNGLVGEIARVLQDATFIYEITDVERQWVTTLRDAKATDDATAILGGNCAPSGPHMWFEWAWLDGVGMTLGDGEVVYVKQDLGVDRSGCFILAVDKHERYAKSPTGDTVLGLIVKQEPRFADARWIYMVYSFGGFVDRGEQNAGPLRRANDLLQLVVFYGVRPDGTVIPNMPVMPLDANGRVAQGFDGKSIDELQDAENGLPATERPVTTSMLLALQSGAFAMYALSLSHCINIVRQEQRPDVSRQQQRQRERAGLPPYVSFSVLRVRHGDRLMSFGELGGNRGIGDGVAAHVIPGRVRTYTEERRLFGKHAGSWYWHPYLRGNPDRGARVHAYRLS